MILVPAIDIMDGKCVRLTQGRFDETRIYEADPVEMARRFEGEGITHVHLVDLDGARQSSIVHWSLVEKICRQTRLRVDFGGGINSQSDLDRLAAIGVSQVNIGSLALSNRMLVMEWLSAPSSSQIILSADIKENAIASAGWTRTSEMHWKDFIGIFASQGLGWACCTDISKDGMLEGPNIGLYSEITACFPALNVIASGGITSAADIERLSATGVARAIVGKALYEGRLTVAQLADWNQKN
jgi:phosphoribosylformimino-5-aminoimidazole carboxamide ribotide isomerase